MAADTTLRGRITEDHLYDDPRSVEPHLVIRPDSWDQEVWRSEVILRINPSDTNKLRSSFVHYLGGVPSIEGNRVKFDPLKREWVLDEEATEKSRREFGDQPTVQS